MADSLELSKEQIAERIAQHIAWGAELKAEIAENGARLARLEAEFSKGETFEPASTISVLARGCLPGCSSLVRLQTPSWNFFVWLGLCSATCHASSLAQHTRSRRSSASFCAYSRCVGTQLVTQHWAYILALALDPSAMTSAVPTPPPSAAPPSPQCNVPLHPRVALRPRLTT